MKQMRNLKERICAFVLVAAVMFTGILPNMSIAAQAAGVNAYFFVYEEDANNPENKVPVKGAELKIGDITYTTDEEGKCSAENVPEGTAIVVSRTGYEKLAANPTVELGTSEVSPQEIQLTMADIELDNADVTIKKGETGSVSFADGNMIEEANNLTYNWSVLSGENVVSIDPSTGIITAKEKGTATIQVERNGNKKQKTIVVKDEFTMNITANPQTRPGEGTTDVVVTVTGIPADAGTALVSVSGVDNIDPQEVSADTQQVTFTIPEGKYEVTFKVAYEESEYYFESNAETEITYKAYQPISVADTFTKIYSYGEGPIDFFTEPEAIKDLNGREVSFELDEKGKEVLRLTENNKLEIIGVGEAQITIKAAENDEYLEATTTCNITVNKKQISAVDISKISWNSASKIYDGDNEVTVSGSLPKECGLVGEDTVTISVNGTVDSADAKEYKTFNYMSPDEQSLTTDKYEITLDDSEKEDLPIANGGSIEITPRTVYVQIENGTELSCEYGSKASIEKYIQDNAKIELVNSTGVLDDKENTGLVGEDVNSEDIKNTIKSAVQATLENSDNGAYYVGDYAIQPEIINSAQGNYELAVPDSIENYSGILHIEQEVVTSDKILEKLTFTTDAAGVYPIFSDDKIDKIWVKNGTILQITSEDPNYTDVYLKRGEEESYNLNQITLSSDSDEEGYFSVNDIYAYLHNTNDDDTRTTSDKNKTTDTLIPENTIFIDNELPAVEFKSLGDIGAVDPTTSYLNYVKFAGEAFDEGVTVTDEGSGVAKVYSKLYQIADDSDQTLEQIINAATEENGWTEETGWNSEGTKNISVPAANEGYFVLLVKAADNVGNEVVSTSNGIVIDTTSPVILIDEENVIDSEEVYKDDQTYSIKAEDALSGIDKIEVVATDSEGNKIEGSLEDQSDSFTISNLVPDSITKAGLKERQNYKLDATISKPENKSTDMTIQATAYDKVGNKTVSAEKVVKFDTKNPEGTYSYDNNDYQIVENQYYFKSNRTMTITYTECHFVPEKATFKISVDGQEYETNLQEWNEDLIAAGVKLNSDYEDTQAGYDGAYTDERQLTYTIEFGAEGAEHTYTISEMAVTDAAGNPGIVTPVNSQEPTEFIIDRKAPEITIAYSSTDDDAKNVNYFNSNRIMTVTYTETYFDESKVKLSLRKGSEDDEKTLVDWLKENSAEDIAVTKDKDNSKGNKHIYQVTFGAEKTEGEYSVNTSMTDWAGNPSEAVVYENDKITNTKTDFVIDQKAPEITIAYDLNDKKASNEKYFNSNRIMTVTYTETYFDESKVKLSLRKGSEDDEKTLADWLNENNAEESPEKPNPEENKNTDIEVKKVGIENVNEHIYQVTFGAKGYDEDYNVITSMTDYAENSNEKVKYEDEANIENTKQSFTVDQKLPSFKVEYSINKEAVEPGIENKIYTNQKVEATVTITERNFSLGNQFSAVPEDQMQIKFEANGAGILNEEKIFSNAKVSTEWENIVGTDQWKQTFTFDVADTEDIKGDADFNFQITYADLANNSEESGEYYLTVDKVVPVISVTYYADEEEKKLITMENETRTYLQDKVYAKFQIEERNGWINVNTESSGEVPEDYLKTDYETTKEDGDPYPFEEYAKKADEWKKESSNRIIQRFDFTTQANYTIGMSYTDLAGNKATYGNCEFTVDWTAPTGEITIPDSSQSKGGTWKSGIDTEFDGIWAKLSNIIYTFFTGESHAVTMEGSDETSGVKEIYYYIDDTVTKKTEVKYLSEAELEAITNWNQYTPGESQIIIALNSQAAIYEKVVDNSGNVTYLNAGRGIISDDVKPKINLQDMSPTRNGLHYDDVTIRVTVEDPKYNDVGVYSGIEKVEYTIKSTTNKVATESDSVVMRYDEESDERSRTGSGTITVDAEKFNSNDVTVTATVYDLAGNTETAEIDLSIDATAPVIESIQWNTNDASNGKYYNETRVATITVRERNFDPNQVRLNITNTDGTAAQVSSWRVDSSGTSDNNINTCTVTFSADGDYNMNVSCTDKAGWTSNTVTAEEFTIDKTVPTINVSFDNNSVANGKYYNAARTATITVNEHNFNGSDVQTAITSNTSTPGVNGWGGSGNVHTATVPFTTDGEYSFTVNYTDLAGNAAQVYSVDEFVIDLTKPEIEIFDIEDKSANNGVVAPGVRYSDTNYDVAGVSITYSGPNHPEEAVDGTRTAIPNGESIKMADFAHTEATDDVYTMVAQVTDLAGNSEEKQVTFSVNRFGSNFIFSDATKDFLDDYYNNEEEDLVVTEINVDTLTHRGITSGHDGSTTDLTEGTDYTVRESGSEVSWKSYQYTISKENFEKEGMYSITIDSVDRATNQVNNKIKEANIDFVIDKTAPTVVITGIEDGGQYRSDTRDITVSVADNVAMEKVDVYTNDGNKETTEPYDEDMIRSQNGELAYTLTSSSDWQEIKAVAVDKAGNVTDTSLTDGSDSERWMSVLVTSNLFVQFYRNTPLLIGTIVAVAAIGGGLFFLILAKKRKKDEEEQQAAQ